MCCHLTCCFKKYCLQDHSAVSASALQLIGSLIHHQHKTALSVHVSRLSKLQKQLHIMVSQIFFFAYVMYMSHPRQFFHCLGCAVLLCLVPSHLSFKNMYMDCMIILLHGPESNIFYCTTV